MNAEIRRSGIGIIGDIPWGTHFCQFYRSAEDLSELLVPYFAAGLEANEFCMWVTSKPVDKTAAAAALAAGVPGFERHLLDGRIEIIPHDEWYLAGGTFDAGRVMGAWARKLDDARSRGFEGLRLSGNTFWLERKDWRAFADYEAAVDEVIGQSRMLALCTYSLAHCGADEVLDVVRNHRFALVRRGGDWDLVESAERERARETERRLAQFPQQNPHPVLRVGQAGDVIFANPAAKRFLAASGAAPAGPIPAVVAGLAARAFDQPGPVDAEARDGEGRTYLFTAVCPPGESFVNLYAHDATARGVAEEALRESEARYRALFENMSEGFAIHEIITDESERPVDYRFLDLNPAFERLTGLPRHETVGRTVREVLKGIEPFWIETFGRVALKGEPYQFERYYPEPLNRWFEVHAYSPGPRRFATVFMDISERKRTEAALRESERRYQRSQEIAHLGSWELDVSANRLTWSDEVYRIFGLEPREFGATYEAFLAAVHPEDRRAVDEAYSGSLREGIDSYEIEHRIVRRGTGEVRTVHEKCEHFRDASGRIVRSVGMVHDITERKRSEALRQALAEQERLRLGAAVEMASEAVVMAEPDGRIVYVNAAFETINRLSKDAAVGRNIFDLVVGDPRAAGMREAVARGEAWNGRLTLTRPGERPVELEVVTTSVRDPLGVLITERDITQEVILQNQVRQAQKMESLGTLAGGIAHDFNNILGAIVINAELALMEAEEKQAASESLPLVLRAADRGKELVRQIIAFSRQKAWERSPLHIAPVVRETLRLFRATLPAAMTLDESIGADEAVVLGHPAQIHQVLMNLCQNAALAMRGKPGTMEVRLAAVLVDEAMAARHPDLKPGRYAQMTVADAGCGMPREVVERIFEPFFTTRKPGEGSGLGLSVVHGIVQSFGGTVTVYSEVGRGSTFNVFFPLLEDGSAPEESETAPQVERGSETVLLVDDDPAQLKSLGRTLEKLGYRVITRSSGEDAAAAFAKDPAAVDLVITDQTMPSMSGMELARRLVRVRPDVRIILNTGFSEKVSGETVGRDGIRALLMKPFTATELSGLIRKVLKNGR